MSTSDGTFRGELAAALDQALADHRHQMARSSEEVAIYAEQRAFDVAQAMAAQEPGLDRVREAAVHAVVAFAALAVVGQADAADARVRGTIDMALRLGSLSLARALGVPT